MFSSARTNLYVSHTLVYYYVHPLNAPPPSSSSPATPEYHHGEQSYLYNSKPNNGDVQTRPPYVTQSTYPSISIRPALNFGTIEPQSSVYPTLWPAVQTRPQTPPTPAVIHQHPTDSTQFFTPTSTLPATTTTKDDDSSHTQDCGHSVKSVVLVMNGKQTSAGDWPWLAAMYKKTDTGQNFECGGSLISTRHVLTAAHCVKRLDQPVMLSRDVTVIVGKFNLRVTEEHNQYSDVSHIIVHPKYVATNAKNDIAILMLVRRVKITAFVRPVCVWPANNDDLSEIVHHEGMVIGWGRNEQNTISDEPKLARMPVVSQEECLRSHSTFVQITSNTSFCAGRRDGSGPCLGDSGSGLFLPQLTPDGSKRWMLRGIVSQSLKHPSAKCDLTNYVVFTDVAKFAIWIRDKMAQNTYH